jgi:hypothetical protein
LMRVILVLEKGKYKKANCQDACVVVYSGETEDMGEGLIF